jgi:uncharacterized protein (DUF1697 family)
VTSYLVLLRGINVGGRNRVPMAQLRELLEDLGFEDVSTYIASGNVLLRSDLPAGEVRRCIEAALPAAFRLDSDLISVLVLTHAELRAAIDRRPAGFGEDPETYLCDVIFLIELDVASALTVFNPRPGVDRVWPGDGVIYSERLSAERTKSRLNRIMGSPAYRQMTVRSWKTAVALLALLEQAAASR